MPRNASITVGDLAGKLEFLELTCAKCGRRGRYRVSTLLAELGPDGMLTYWHERMIANCPRVQRKDFSDWCGASSPDLVRLFGTGAD